MPRIKFDKRTIDKLPYARKKEQIDYFDTDVPGLALRVGTSSKTFFVKTDIRDTSKKSGYRTVKKTLGRYGDITLEETKRMVEGRTEIQNGQKVFVPGARLELKHDTYSDNRVNVTLDDMLEAYFQDGSWLPLTLVILPSLHRM